MNLEEIQNWFAPDKYSDLVRLLVNHHIGLTRTRADYFIRLWIYLLVKQKRQDKPDIQPPFQKLEPIENAVLCTHREAAEVFYSESERGSDRSAGMMLDKLASLGLIKKHFDGNTTSVEIPSIPIIDSPQPPESISLFSDTFNPRSDAIPVANLLAIYYNWMDETSTAIPRAARIAKLLRTWGNQYQTGMRVLRRSDNQNPVGFYVIYPVSTESEIHFFSPPNRSLSIGWIEETDPFKMAIAGDTDCISVFTRGWFIESQYSDEYQLLFLQDAQQTIRTMQRDFPNLQDLYAILIHPSFEKLVNFLGCLRMNPDPQSSLTWLYLSVDRFLELDLIEAAQKYHQFT